MLLLRKKAQSLGAPGAGIICLLTAALSEL